MTEVEKKKGMRPPGTPTYPQNVIDQALLAMAYTRQAKAAHTQLKLAGVSPLPGESTLRLWRNKYSGRLAELTEKHGAEIERHTVATYMDVTTKATEATDILIDKTLDQAKEGNLRDPAGSARNMATIAAIYQDKILLIQGKPTKIIGREKDAEESLRSLANRFAVDSDAKEEGPKELES